MTVRNVRRKPAFHWVPPDSSAAFKIEVVRTDGTVDDVTDRITSFEIENGVKDNIGTFSLIIENGDEFYTGLWDNMNEINYYSDYAADATTLQFHGLIEKISYTNNMLKVTGRTDGLRFMEITVTQNYMNKELSFILKDLVDKYGEGRFTYTGVELTAIYITKNWYQKPFWECINELCDANNMLCYIDETLDFQFFAAGSRNNDSDAIIHTYNLLEVGDFGADVSQVFNRVVVYGAEQEGVQILYTSEDKDSQNKYSTREKIEQNNNITTYNQAVEYGDYLLSVGLNPPIIGEVTGLLLAGIKPGQMMYLSSPDNNIPPQRYECNKYKHSIDINNGLTTTVEINKEQRTISHIIKSMIVNSGDGEQTSTNPYEMRYAYTFLFNEDSGTHSNTEIVNGVLRPTAAAGTWISDLRDLSTNIEFASARLNGSTIDAVTIYASGDNGVNWKKVNRNELSDMSTAFGRQLRVKVEFSSASAELDSLSLQYKLD